MFLCHLFSEILWRSYNVCSLNLQDVKEHQEDTDCCVVGLTGSSCDIFRCRFRCASIQRQRRTLFVPPNRQSNIKKYIYIFSFFCVHCQHERSSVIVANVKLKCKAYYLNNPSKIHKHYNLCLLMRPQRPLGMQLATYRHKTERKTKT